MHVELHNYFEYQKLASNTNTTTGEITNNTLPHSHGTSGTRYIHIPLIAQVIHGNYPQAYMHDYAGMQLCRGM